MTHLRGSGVGNVGAMRDDLVSMVRAALSQRTAVPLAALASGMATVVLVGWVPYPGAVLLHVAMVLLTGRIAYAAWRPSARVAVDADRVFLLAFVACLVVGFLVMKRAEEVVRAEIEAEEERTAALAAPLDFRIMMVSGWKRGIDDLALGNEPALARGGDRAARGRLVEVIRARGRGWLVAFSALYDDWPALQRSLEPEPARVYQLRHLRLTSYRPGRRGGTRFQSPQQSLTDACTDVLDWTAPLRRLRAELARARAATASTRDAIAATLWLARAREALLRAHDRGYPAIETAGE